MYSWLLSTDDFEKSPAACRLFNRSTINSRMRPEWAVSSRVETGPKPRRNPHTTIIILGQEPLSSLGKAEGPPVSISSGCWRLRPELEPRPAFEYFSKLPPKLQHVARLRVVPITRLSPLVSVFSAFANEPRRMDCCSNPPPGSG
ncbi:hypothetical protein CPLU01_10869 [Colletotrichum plurivorum]|uniref:Uncharacterized protein n=1 Tax=Colletotrichum plurivorum TaxID=2175906 RepID=A0A8H6K4V8_9PEZI|nr:hypothetical protein CPLU01_10869 [Colletotrichum plurivorum]